MQPKNNITTRRPNIYFTRSAVIWLFINEEYDAYSRTRTSTHILEMWCSSSSYSSSPPITSLLPQLPPVYNFLSTSPSYWRGGNNLLFLWWEYKCITLIKNNHANAHTSMWTFLCCKNANCSNLKRIQLSVNLTLNQSQGCNAKHLKNHPFPLFILQNLQIILQWKQMSSKFCS